MKIKFIEKQLDVQNESTRYWFYVDGAEFAVVEGNSGTAIINQAGDDVYNRSLEAKLRANLVLTDGMRAE